MIYPIARLPDSWIEQGRMEGAHVDFTLKSPWQLFAAFDGEQAQGFVGLLLVSETKCTVRGWYVFPEHRSKGIGSALLRRCISWASDNGYLEIDIRTAHRVEHHGFAWTGYEREGGNRERHYRMSL